MSKHTPSPWHWELRYCGLRGANGRSVLVTDGMGIPDYSPESEANARLIASAPELLMALKRAAIDLSERLEASGDLADSVTLATVHAAIAKAEGRT